MRSRAGSGHRRIQQGFRAVQRRKCASIDKAKAAPLSVPRVPDALARAPAQVAELVDALVSGTSAARRGGSSSSPGHHSFSSILISFGVSAPIPAPGPRWIRCHQPRSGSGPRCCQAHLADFRPLRRQALLQPDLARRLCADDSSISSRCGATPSASWPRSVENKGVPQLNAPRTIDEIAITFVNHATFLIQVDGIAILTDPVWSERVSPVSWAGPKRVRKPGVAFDDLPPIDLVLLSHNHYDHLDRRDAEAAAASVLANRFGCRR